MAVIGSLFVTKQQLSKCERQPLDLLAVAYTLNNKQQQQPTHM